MNKEEKYRLKRDRLLIAWHQRPDDRELWNQMGRGLRSDDWPIGFGYLRSCGRTYGPGRISRMRGR